MNTYSHSKLSCFEQCRLKFKFSYIDEVETDIEETVEAFLGKRVHETLEKLYKDLKFEKLNSLKELLDFYNEEWKKNWNDGIVIVKADYDQENYRKMGERFITDYYNQYKPFDQARTIGLETQGFAELGDYKVHVRIDRLALSSDGVYEIHDYKTSNSLPAQSDLDSDRQLAVYAYGVKSMYPDASKVKLIWHFLAFGKEMQSVRSDDQLETLKKEVVKLIKEIEKTDSFPANSSKLCEWCEFMPLCPNFKHKFSLEKKSAKEYRADDGVKLVNEYSTLSTEIKEKSDRLEEVKSSLLDFAKQKKVDVVYGSDVRASIRCYPRLSFPKKEDKNRDEFFSAVRKLGLWDKLAMVDTYELAKMINNGEVGKQLDKFIERGETIRVYLGRT